jgi:alkylation response protein AidB-like acyl-CoA dehydrogenase
VASWPTPEESELGEGIRKLLESSTAIERDLVDQIGAPGLAVAEDLGGSGADVGALAVLALEVGRRAATVPYLPAVLAASVLSGKDLESVLSGATVALAVPLDGSAPRVRVVDGALLGTASHVIDATGASLVLVATDDGLWAADADAPGITLTPLQTMDLTRPQARLDLDSVLARKVEGDAAGIAVLAGVLLAAEQVGGARWCLATATAHASVREQFGSPIGSFQAVKHLLADLLVQTELAHCLLADAVDALRPASGQSRPAIDAAVHAAVVAAADLGAAVTAGTIQVLGGIGFTWEHDVHRYFRRARASAQLTGSGHRDALAQLLLTETEVRTTLDVDPSVAEFADRASTWLAANAEPKRMRAGDEESQAAHVAAAKTFQRSLYDAGLAGITWPQAYGGQGLTSDHDLAFAQAARGRNTYTDLFGIGLGMCAPVLMTLGSEEQRAHVLPMLRAETVWCQLFSEPGAGSDLAALRTRAELQDDGSWIVNGDKVWTTYAHHSDYGLLLARTDASVPKHRGITMFIVDMKAPGVTPSPLRQMTGESEFNEVHLENVRLPADAVVGAPGDGWKAAVTMLMNERVTLGRDPLAMASPVTVDAARQLVLDTGKDHDAVVRHKLADVWVLQRSLELLGNSIAASVRAGEDPGPFASIGKLGAGTLAARTAAFAADVAGMAGTAWPSDDPEGGLWAYGSLFAPALSIAGGTSEIQRSIIGERLLGLPR